MCYIIIHYLNQCFAKQSNLFSSLFTLIFSLETTILEKREERIEKSEENKRNDNLPKENCRFFLCKDYKKDIFGRFAYDFELSQNILSFLI